MKVSVEAIKFNHDPLMATADAINIRKNEAESVPIPEWRRDGTNAPAAYAISETAGNTITIQAKFSCDPPVNTLEIRATDPARNPILSEVEDLLDNVFSWLTPIPRVLSNNVLGTVKGRAVAFDEHGESNFERFELENVRVQDIGVSVSTTRWRWQFRLKASGSWIDFDTTDHRIYTVLKIPKEPWSQAPMTQNNIELPWAEVLEYACSWASGAQNTDEATVGVTTGVRHLEQTTRAVYDFGPHYSKPHFDCTAFLDLAAGGPGSGLKLNCDDFATVVSSFANILGCELWQAGLSSGLGFKTNPIRLFGRTTWQAVNFTGHTVAWEGACNEDEDLYDACLEVDSDEDPTLPPQTPLLPTNLRFGRPGERLYIFRLAPPETATQSVPTPALNRKRRAIHPNPKKPGIRIKGRLLRFIKEHYRYADWRRTQREGLSFFPGIGFSLPLHLEHWKQSTTIFQSSNRPTMISTLLQNTSHPDLLMRVDIDVCESENTVSHFVLQCLGGFDSAAFERRTSDSIGNVTFDNPESSAILFARGNLVILVSNAAHGYVPLEATARELNRLIGLPSEEGEPFIMYDFAIPDREFYVGEQIPLTHTDSISYTAFKFFTPSGFVRQVSPDGDFAYEPLSAGLQDITIFANGSDDQTYRQRLTLNVKDPLVE